MLRLVQLLGAWGQRALEQVAKQIGYARHQTERDSEPRADAGFWRSVTFVTERGERYAQIVVPDTALNNSLNQSKWHWVRLYNDDVLISNFNGSLLVGHSALTNDQSALGSLALNREVESGEAA